MMEKQAGKIVLVVILCVILLAGLFFAMYSACALTGGVRLKVDVNKTFQTMEGFGASAAWWYQMLGAYDGVGADEFRQEVIDLVYGDEGLGLNIFRYNIGGGSWDLFRRGVSDYATYNDGRGRRRDALTESFFKLESFTGDYAVFSDPNNYTLEADEQSGHDESTQLMMRMALESGNIRRVVAFSNSPHYLMTKSGYCMANESHENNLKAECFEAFADYTIISTYKLYVGIIEDYDIPSSMVQISPVNEPQHAWSVDTTDQEGCHYDPEYLVDFYQVFYERLRYWNGVWGTEFKMDIFESGNYDNHINQKAYKNIWQYLKAFQQKEFWGSIDEISIHSYGTDHKDAIRRYFNTKLKAKGYDNFPKISMSEYCDMIPGRDYSMKMAVHDSRVINGDLSVMNAVAWSWWLSISSEDYNSTLVYYDVKKNDTSTTLDDEYVVSLPKRYYAMKHYSAFIDAGDVRVNVSASDFINFASLYKCAFLKTDGRLVMVITNEGKSQKVNLKGLNYSHMTTYLTTADEDWAVSEGEFKSQIVLPANSIITIVLS